MKKKDEIIIDGIRYWDIEEQTIIKHQVVQDYIDVWIKILGKYNTLSVFDCYGGNGIYLDSKKTTYFGSPILILNKIEENSNNLGRSTNLVIIEKNKRTFENLNAVIEKEGYKDKCKLKNADFNDIAKEVIIRASSSANLFFIDPFGYDVDFDNIKEIMSLDKTEIILNFMFNGINRGISVQSVDNTSTKLFGCEDWKQFTSMTGRDRENGIVSLYRDQCKKIAQYVFPYRLRFPTKDRSYYYLFHLTNNAKGASIMKTCFAKYNNGRVEYLGKLRNQLSIFDLMKDQDIEQYLINEFQGQTISFQDIISQIIDSCPFTEPEIRASLKNMKKDGKVSIEQITTIRGLNGLDSITFKS